jgi:hypothetical protein
LPLNQQATCGIELSQLKFAQAKEKEMEQHNRRNKNKHAKLTNIQMFQAANVYYI